VRRPTALGSAAELLLATGHDPYVRSSLRSPGVQAWHDGAAALWFGTDAEERSTYVMTRGAPQAVAELVGELLAELPLGSRVTLPRGTGPLLPAWVGLDGTDWDFRWTATPPPQQPGEDRVAPVDDHAVVGALLAASSPTASALPGDPAVRAWVGVRDDDETLLAVAADTSATTGVGHLSSIAVLPAARGRGLARAVTAALTRRLLADGADVVTLGMYADNDPARRVYNALGFADEHRFTSGPLQVRSRW
jgi:ribosomal protein S18 acetylase RimI-like enzyme